MNRYMPKPYRCNICFRAFKTVKQAEAHWYAAHAAIADTHAQRGDVKQAPSLMSGGGAQSAIAHTPPPISRTD